MTDPHRPRPTAEPTDHALWDDVEALAQHTALARSLRERGLDPAAEAEAGSSVPRGTPPRTRRFVAIALAVLATLLGGGAAAVHVARAATPPSIAEQGVTYHRMLQEDAARIEGARTLIGEPDPSISAEAASSALHALTSGQAGAHFSPGGGIRAPERRYDPADLAPLETLGVTRGIASPPLLALIEKAATRSLSAAEERGVRSLSAAPVLAELETLGHATGADPTWYYDLARVEADTYLDLYMTGRTPRIEVGQAQVAAAASDLQRGDAASAEHRLRDLVAAGTLVFDNATNAIDAALGHVWARQGMDALAVLYEATGRSAEAAHVRRALEGAYGRPFTHTALGADENRAGEVILATIADPAVPRAAKWEMYQELRLHDYYCAPVPGLEEGSLARTQLEKDVRTALVRYPGERWLLDLIRKTPQTLTQQSGPLGSVLRSCTF